MNLNELELFDFSCLDHQMVLSISLSMSLQQIHKRSWSFSPKKKKKSHTQQNHHTSWPHIYFCVLIYMFSSSICICVFALWIWICLCWPLTSPWTFLSMSLGFHIIKDTLCWLILMEKVMFSENSWWLMTFYCFGTRLDWDVRWLLIACMHWPCY